MSSTEGTLAILRREMHPLLETAMESVLTKVRRALEDAEQERTEGLVLVAEERAKGLTEVAEERTEGLAEVDARRTELSWEIAAMHMHQEVQERRVELNIGGHRFETSVQALGASHTRSLTRTSAAGTRTTCATTVASSWIGTGSTSDMFWSTCATVIYRWLSLAHGRACPCYVS
jgi:hypothetical protein